MDKSEIIRETPFLEKDFAVWMDQLESKLLSILDWREILKYRGLSVYDAAYMLIYYGFLNEYKKAYLPNNFLEGSSNRSLWDVQQVINRLTNGKNKISNIPRIVQRRLRARLRMFAPPKQIPKYRDDKLAIVVRAYPNITGFPVLEYLNHELGWSVLFASWNSKLAKPVKRIGINYMEFEDVYRRQYFELRKKHSSIVHRQLDGVNVFLPGEILSELSGFPLTYGARSLFYDALVRVRIYTDIYFHFLEHCKPAVIVLFNQVSPPGRTMAKVAELMEVPSLAVQHGLFIGYAYRSLATDKMLVWGPIAKDFWLHMGCPAERIICVGAIGHEKQKEQVSQNRTIFPANVTRGKILIVGQNPGLFISLSLYSYTLEIIIKAAEQLHDFTFVIKPHPGEDPEIHRNILQNSRSNNIKIITDGPIENFLAQADLVISLHSTVGIEAMLMGIPVIVVSCSQEPSLAPYAAVTPTVTNIDSLISEIDLIFSHPAHGDALIAQAKKFAHEYFGAMDGYAAQRAAQEITIGAQKKMHSGYDE